MKIGAQRIIKLQPQAGFFSAAKRFRQNMPQVLRFGHWALGFGL